MKELLSYITDHIERSKNRYEIHRFDSGAIMIDIWKDETFYVIQLDSDKIGLSVITEDNPGFDTTPDRSFVNVGDFKVEFEKIFL